MNGSWTLIEYKIEDLKNDIDKKKITVPKYQRGAVWNKQQKDKLIDSLNKGYPFGSILLYEKSGVKQIIDGLQRSNTIIEFVNNPSKFFVDENLDESIIVRIENLLGISNINEYVKEELIELIVSWVKENHCSMVDIQRMQYGDLADKIIEKWPTANENKNILKAEIKNLFTEFQNICSTITNMSVPALVYNGEESLLPEIFERINSQGAKLTKQQIYSATWANDFVKIEDPSLLEIVNINRNRYEKMLDDNIELEDFNSKEYIIEKTVNIFELIFGFGKKISREYPYLFTCDPNDDVKVESVGFSIINACLLQRTNNMSALNKNLEKYIGLNTENIEKFLKKIIEAIEFVDKRLGKGTKFKCNTRADSKIMPLHTEMQIVSIIATVFILRHVSFKKNDKDEIIELEIDLDNYSLKWHNSKKVFEDNILKIYSMDILGQKWKGSGDKKLDNIILDNYYYSREVSWEEFEKTLDVYYNSLNSERGERKQVSNPKEPERLVLNLIYSGIFSASDQNDDSKYDIEHIAPKNLMKERISQYSDELRLPISSIANLCLLPEYDNRVKRDKTIYQDKKYLEKVNLEEIEKKYTFTMKSDLEWINEMDLSEEQFKKSYFRFLDERYKEMKNKIKQNLFN